MQKTQNHKLHPPTRYQTVATYIFITQISQLHDFEKVGIGRTNHNKNPSQREDIDKTNAQQSQT